MALVNGPTSLRQSDRRCRSGYPAARARRDQRAGVRPRRGRLAPLSGPQAYRRREDSPLYGRATYRPLLRPLDFRHAAGFTTRTDPELLLRRFGTLGGTPQYQAWAGDLPLTRILPDRILRQGRPLYDDPLHLLRAGERIRSPGSYLSILWSIARGDSRFNDIANRTGLRGPNLSERLERLQELAYLEFKAPSDPKDQSRRGVYRIADPYFRFWFRYVFPHRSRLELGRVDEVAAEVAAEIEGDFDNHMGPIFED